MTVDESFYSTDATVIVQLKIHAAGPENRTPDNEFARPSTNRATEGMTRWFFVSTVLGRVYIFLFQAHAFPMENNVLTNVVVMSD